MSRARKIIALGLQEEVCDRLHPLADLMLADIAMERVLQDQQWGGQQTDDGRVPADWAQYIHHQLSKMFQEEGGERDRFVKVAALAAAAIESIDRKAKAESQPCDCPVCSLERELLAGGDMQVIRVGSMSELVALLSGLRPRSGSEPG